MLLKRPNLSVKGFALIESEEPGSLEMSRIKINIFVIIM